MKLMVRQFMAAGRCVWPPATIAVGRGRPHKGEMPSDGGGEHRSPLCCFLLPANTLSPIAHGSFAQAPGLACNVQSNTRRGPRLVRRERPCTTRATTAREGIDEPGLIQGPCIWPRPPLGQVFFPEPLAELPRRGWHRALPWPERGQFLEGREGRVPPRPAGRRSSARGSPFFLPFRPGRCPRFGGRINRRAQKVHVLFIE
jgi:hypothetical protein